ncbi:hypothetical protein TSUD_287110 [Trifolium subterraneum]|uniref:Uncharacterized protein n=1 Tax=Trifolium subterraneum TaxID=3900 RepID=A0A2Z6PIH7_TRISU|nr:hypothetical protein TSUD_287110 [Trifolium subterraneum]
MVATVTNGDAIPVLQSRVAEAGFSNLDILPMGADKVLIRKAVPAQRGAWVRLYGIPLHTWNEHFFKLCVLDSGRYLRTDSCTMEKVRLDYARILIATSALDIVKGVEKLLIDGELLEVKIIEE